MGTVGRCKYDRSCSFRCLAEDLVAEGIVEDDADWPFRWSCVEADFFDLLDVPWAEAMVAGLVCGEDTGAEELGVSDGCLEG